MEITETNLNEKCLPCGKRPKRIIGAKAVLLTDIQNRGGGKLEKGDIVTVCQSFRGYGLMGSKNGRTIEITRVEHSKIRFLK